MCVLTQRDTLDPDGDSHQAARYILHTPYHSFLTILTPTSDGYSCNFVGMDENLIGLDPNRSLRSIVHVDRKRNSPDTLEVSRIATETWHFDLSSECGVMRLRN